MSTNLAALMLAMLLAIGGETPKPVFAVMPTSLNNLSPEPNSHGDSVALGRLAEEARTRLAACGYPVIAADTLAATEIQGPSYLFEHADVVAAWGASHHADWVMVGRLNRIGTWEADWEVEVVSVPARRAVNIRSVELKGFDIDQALSDRLAIRGAAWIVDQVTQSIAGAAPGDSAAARPCRA
jgi:hypothetical protein